MSYFEHCILSKLSPLKKKKKEKTDLILHGQKLVKPRFEKWTFFQANKIRSEKLYHDIYDKFTSLFNIKYCIFTLKRKYYFLNVE